MDVSVIGTGRIGSAVGTALARAGHRVTFGSRRPDQAVHDAAPTVPLPVALAASPVVVIAIPAGGVTALVEEHAEALDGKLVVDAANNVGSPVVNNAEPIRRLAPSARYARAFNSLGVECLLDPMFDGTPADMFFACGPDDRAILEELIDAVGLRPVYVGEDPVVVDGVLRLWLALAMGQGWGRQLAFRTVTRPG
ncbi:MAG TPA: NAD(P)-binding domain-containing protein [Acidimicrobiales bacterium]|nr:NAD(P)-binding domain-containing protein [Acidimicrobiales bacterium]